MNLSTIHNIKDQYKKHISTADYDGIYKWRALYTFKQNWDIEELDFASMYERSFAHSLSNPLWEGTHYYPKKAMLAFIREDKEVVRTMFRDLYDESREIDGRVDRFAYHCDQIRADIMRAKPDYQPHFHDDFKMISVYLAFKYPTQYCIYHAEGYLSFMKAVNAKPLPEGHDIERFFKVMRTLYKIISKDVELIERHSELREGLADVWQDETLLICHDIIEFCYRNNS